MAREIEVKKVGRGQRMIKVEVSFWTDGLAPAGHIRPRHCWDTGKVRVTANSDHEIPSQDLVMFNRSGDLRAAISQALKNAGVTVHGMGG